MIWFVLGIILGLVIGIEYSLYIQAKHWYAGNLHIKKEEIDTNPYLFLELSKNPHELDERKFVIFKVKHDDSRK